MSLQRTFATLAEAQEIYRAQLSRQRLFVELASGAPQPGTRVTVALAIEETGGRLELPAAVVRALDAETARAHSLGNQPGVVLAITIDDTVREPLRALLTGQLRGEPAPTGAAQRDAPPPGDDTLARLAHEVAAFNARTESANHYEVLGVEPGTAGTGIRSSYLKLIRRFHPDTHFKRVDAETQAALELAYQRVTTAFETLADPRRRDKYDVSIGNFSDTSDGSSAHVKAQVARLEAYRQKNAAGIQRARELWESALSDISSGDLKSARNKLRLAMTFDPQNPLFRRKLDELQRGC